MLKNIALLTLFQAFIFGILAQAESTSVTNTGKTSSEQTTYSLLESPRKLAYLTSWEQPATAADDLQQSNADAYILAFARWDKGARISSSDNVIKIPANTSLASHAYSVWTELAFKNPDIKFLISFGGQEFEDIWEHSSFLQDTEKLAKSIARLLDTKFPVYRSLECSAKHGCSSDTKVMQGNQVVGYVELDGVDFDFEHHQRLSATQNSKMTQLAKSLRELVGKHKLIALTSYHVGADPANCSNTSNFEDCSFTESPRSKHHGEVTSLLQETIGIFDFYNVMAYDAGVNFDYVTAMRNYATRVGNPSKLRLGISINKQWGSAGPFLMSHEDRLKRVKWQAKNVYGGIFVWALGANTEDTKLSDQVDIFNTMQQFVDTATSNQ